MGWLTPSLMGAGRSGGLQSSLRLRCSCHPNQVRERNQPMETSVSLQLLVAAIRAVGGPVPCSLSTQRLPLVLMGVRHAQGAPRMPLSCKSTRQFYYVNKWCLHIHLLLLLLLVMFMASYVNKQQFHSNRFISFLVSH